MQGGAHSSECVQRVQDALMQSPEWATRIEDANERHAERTARKLQAQAAESEAKRIRTTERAEPPVEGTEKTQAMPPGSSGDAPADERADTPVETADADMEDSTAEPASKRARLNVLTTDHISLRRANDRAGLRRAIGGGVDVVLSLEPMAPESENVKERSILGKIRRDIYGELVEAGGFFAHVHHGMDVHLMELAGAMSTQMKSGWRVSTNSGAVLRKAGRLDAADSKGELPPEDTMKEIRDFVMSQHVQETCSVHEAEKLWSKESSDVRDLCTMIHPDSEVWDDVKGGWLPAEAVKEARREEMRFVRDAPLYRKVSRSVPFEKNMKIIPVRWVDTNKGTEEKPQFRSRIVAMEFKKASADKSTDHELFAAMPPIEALRLVVSHAATTPQGEEKRELMVADVRRAYFCARARRPIYVEIPAEDWEDGDEHRCAELIQSMYGTRDAARNWSEELRKTMVSMKAIPGLATPCVHILERDGRTTKIVIHGDDIVVAGSRADLDYVQTCLEARFSLKIERIGERAELKKTVKVLNRVVGVDGRGYTMEADPRHLRVLKDDLGLHDAKGTSAPTDEATREGSTRGELLPAPEARRFRSAAARLNYLATDRPDVRVAAQAASRVMSSPTTGSWGVIRRAVRYLISHPRRVARYEWQAPASAITCFTDSDWAGDKTSRQSTSGGAILVGTHFMKAWCKTQQAIALSSMEAELYACVLGVIEGKGIQSMAKDLGDTWAVEAFTDSSAALGFVQREGLARTKHVETQWLWMQRQCREGRISVGKVHTDQNPADLLTKPLVGTKVSRFMERLSFEEAR